MRTDEIAHYEDGIHFLEEALRLGKADAEQAIAEAKVKLEELQAIEKKRVAAYWKQQADQYLRNQYRSYSSPKEAVRNFKGQSIRGYGGGVERGRTQRGLIDYQDRR